jgi:GT2 family glycosyltransferase
MILETTEPRGVADARNQALALAGCEIIASIDDDTVADPDLLFELEKVFLRDPRIGIAGGSILNLKREGNDLLSRFMEVIEKL